MTFQDSSKIVEDAQGRRQLQVDVTTVITNLDRCSVLMTYAYDMLSKLEQQVAQLPQEEIDLLMASVKKDEPSPIISPNSLIVTPEQATSESLMDNKMAELEHGAVAQEGQKA